jgi:hypothetical protein
MYLAAIVLLMGVLPLGSILAELAFHSSGADWVVLVGKWFVFWSVGIRLLLAGLRQVVNPAFTAEAIFEVKERAALVIVQELGFGNLSIGLLATLTLFKPQWTVPAAIVGGLFYGMAGLKHLTKGDRNATENVAMVSDLFIFIVLAGYLAFSGFR